MDALELDRRVAHILRETHPGSADRVLVVVMNNLRDWAIVRTQGWYRIPVERAPRRVGADYLAFYLTGAFPEEQRHSVRYYAPVRAYRLATRAELLPDEADHPRALDSYFKIEVGPLERLAHPIHSRKLRRITFIPTTLDLLLNAQEINDLWDKKRGQDELWAALKTHYVEAERAIEIREGTEGAWPCKADFRIPCPGGPVVVICGAERSIARENVLYLADEALEDATACLHRIDQMVDRARRSLGSEL
jgi:hypothetical protein